MNDNKQLQSRFATILKHYQSQLAKQKQLGEFYDKKLNDLIAHQEKLQSLARGASLMQLRQKDQPQYDLEIQKAIAVSSNKSIQLNKESRIKKQSEQKKQGSVDCQFQYNTLVKNIARNLQQISAKTQQKQSKKPFQTTSKMIALVQKAMKTSRIKSQVNKSTLSPNKKLKTQSEVQLSKKEQLLLDFGNNGLLQSEDEIVNNLIQKLKQEEQKYVEGVLAQTELIIQQKMKSYLQKQVQKNEQLLFNMKQKLIDNSLSKISSNKLTLKSGYTEKMKHLVQNGLKHRIYIV